MSAATKYIRIKNWEEYQHYKDRHSPWFKMYGNLTSTHWWVMGNDASKLLAVCTMILAHRTDNKIPYDLAFIKRFAHLEQDPDFAPLVSANFLEINEEPASKPLAKRKQSAPRGEERREEEKEDERFAQFWNLYPKKKAKGDAEKAWVKAHINGDFEKVLEAIRQQSQSADWLKEGGQFIPYPASWINQKRWLDEVSVSDSPLGIDG